jgi:hypothetical protein
MANSSIQIRFNTRLTPDASNFISFRINNSVDGSLKVLAIETWDNYRSGPKTIPYSEEETDSGRITYSDGTRTDAYKYGRYFDIDYNSTRLFTLNVLPDYVEVVCNNSDYSFSDFQTNSDTTADIFNTPPAFSFEITTDSFNESVDNCNYMDLNLVTNIDINRYVLNNVETVVDSNDINLEVIRGTGFKIELIDDENRSIFYPGQKKYNSALSDNELYNIRQETINYDKLLASNITVNVNKNISNTTVKVDVIKVEGLVLEYSLNGTYWQDSNVFSSQGEGDYTMYVKDQFNCIKQKDYTVDAEGSRVPFLIIPKSNPFLMVKVEETDDVSVFKNDSNSFNCDGFERIKYNNNTIFKKTDITEFQLKTNYKNIVAKLRAEDETEQIVSLNLKSNNLSRYEKLDCIYYKHTSGNIAIYFESGNTYNSFNEVTGQYELNGNLPLFAKIGNVISIDNLGSFPIENVLIDSDKNKKIILINQQYNGAEVISKIECLYDLLPFNVYEKSFSFANLEPGLYDLLIEFYNNDVNDKVTFLSENIDINEEQERSLSITSYNNTYNNRDVFYKYGIKFLCRYSFSEIEGYTKEESEINLNDNNLTSIKSSIRFGDRFLFEGLTKKQMEHLSIVLSSEFVFINGIGYLKDGDLDISNDEGTNIYSIEAKMLKTNEIYSTGESIDSGTDELSERVYIPRIDTDGTNFIKS